jgi:hypothetical protein
VIIKEIEDSIIPNSDSVAFPASEIFNFQRTRVFFQGSKNFNDFVVNFGREALYKKMP